MMRNLIISNILILCITPLLMSDIMAQTNFMFGYYLIQDDNAYKSRNKYDEWISTPTMYLGHSYKKDNISVQAYYRGDISSFRNNASQNNYSQQLGISGKYMMNDYVLDLQGYYRVRKNDEQYIYYNVSSYYLNTKLRYSADYQQIFSVGITMTKDMYHEFNFIDNQQYRFYGKYQQFFQSRLSISAEAGVGVKDYINQSIIQYFGPAMGWSPLGSRYLEEPMKSIMFSVAGNAGKSLTDRTGVNLLIGGQWFMGDPIEVYSNGIYYYTENDLYDDAYAYESKYVSMNVTRQFDIGFQGKFSIKYMQKDYKGTPALNENGELLGETRFDTRTEYSFALTKKFLTNWKFPKSVDVSLNFMMRQNPSNDPYYDFNDNVGVFGFTISR